RIAAGDTYGLDHLLSAFGGMGSLNDLLVLRVNGHEINEAQEGAVNTRLDELLNAIWTEATAIRRTIGSSGG
ncbi:DUF6966 domain-containing protein, partial [Actinopolymorpha alba]|uniref:DUF6966 domain-containing protein n=1 Tax=Actinopolymorpha alba TaxID=533267 RepID=UPI0004776A69